MGRSVVTLFALLWFAPASSLAQPASAPSSATSLQFELGERVVVYLPHSATPVDTRKSVCSLEQPPRRAVGVVRSTGVDALTLCMIEPDALKTAAIHPGPAVVHVQRSSNGELEAPTDVPVLLERNGNYDRASGMVHGFTKPETLTVTAKTVSFLLRVTDPALDVSSNFSFGRVTVAKAADGKFDQVVPAPAGLFASLDRSKLSAPVAKEFAAIEASGIHVTGIIRAAGKNAQLNIKVEGGSGGPASPSCSVMYYANSYSAPAEGPATCPDGTPQRGRGKPNATCSRGISCCSGQCVGGYCR